MFDDLREPLKKRAGGSLSRLPPLQRLAMLQRNALMLKGGKWSPPPQNDGTLLKKVVGLHPRNKQMGCDGPAPTAE